MASFFFLTNNPGLQQIAEHPTYRDFLSLLLHVCSISHSGQITQYLRVAYDPKSTKHEVSKYIRSDLHSLVEAGFLAKAQVHIPPPALGDEPLSTVERFLLELSSRLSPEAAFNPSIDQIIAAAVARTPPITAFKTLNVYHATESTRKVLTKYGDPKRKLSIDFGELFAFGITEYYVAEDLTSELACGPAEIAACVKQYQQLSKQTADLLDLTSHELVCRLTYAELIFRLRKQQGTDDFKEFIRNGQFHFAHPRTTKEELKAKFIKLLESKHGKERLEIW